VSAHEYESIVEQSVTFLDQRPNAPSFDLRSCFKSLYEFQSRYDTGFTHLRVIAPLVKHGFVYAFALEDHPSYARYHRVFRGIPGYCEVLRDPTRPWDAKTNPTVGRYCDPVAEWGDAYAESLPPELRRGRLYFDAGGELWRAFVDAGKLTGADAVPPQEIHIQTVAALIAREASSCGDRLLVRMWLPLLCYDLASLGRESLSADPDVQTVRRIAKAMDVLSIRSEHLEYGALQIPPEEIVEEEDTVRWWLALEDV
jgi:hypothetical protein